MLLRKRKATRARTNVVMALAGLASSALGQGLTWTNVTVSGPPGRGDHAMVYDSQRGVAMVFGGFSPAVQGDTWLWNGTIWAQGAVGSPRQAHAMAYDSQRGRTVLFGGTNAGVALGDTWEWNGTTWLPQIFAVGPSARTHQAMTYDSQRGVTVMFGGYDATGYNGQTWLWNGTTWGLAATSGPSAREGHAMAYDSQRGVTVMFGGYDASGYNGETWLWNGTTWGIAPAIGAQPQARWLHAMAYDSQRERVVLFAGEQSGAFNDTWEWDGTTWALVATGPARWAHAMAYDNQRGRLVLFGGNVANTWFGDTWELVAATASATPFGSGCGVPALTLSGVTPPRIGTTAQSLITNIPANAIAFVAIGGSNLYFGPSPLPVSLVTVGMPGCYLLQSANYGIFFPTMAQANGTATFSTVMPNLTFLLGWHLYLQAWATGAPPIVSNGLDWSIGV